MKGILEILTTKEWMVSQDFAHAARKIIEKNLSAHSIVTFKEKKAPSYAVKSSENVNGVDFFEYQVNEDGKKSSRYDLHDMDAPFVNVMSVSGPITRHGGACSDGSMDFRDWMIRASDNKFCKGHVFHIDSPGGSAWAKNDFRLAIDYVHNKGQNVVAIVDGMCASAAFYLASMCDEVYYVNDMDQIGCIGVMAAFYTQKSGSKNVYSDETYHEIYDPESYDKNREIRDVANDGNYELLIKELAELGKEFRSDVLKSFPSATDEHLKGKVFYAKDVVGILCDGKSTLHDVVMRVFNLNDGDKIVERCSPKKKSDSSNTDEESTNMEDTLHVEDSEESSKDVNTVLDEENLRPDTEVHTNISLNTFNIMAYKNVASALSVEEVALNENGEFCLTSENMDSLETTISLVNANIEAANARISELEAERDRANGELETARQAIHDREEQIRALTNVPAREETESPSNNGFGAKVKEDVLIPKYNELLSPVENRRIRDNFFAKLKR